MALEIRTVRPEEMQDFRHHLSIVFVTKETPSNGVLRPEWTLCGFEDGVLATTFGAYQLTMRFNGAAVPVSAITAVATLPIYRRKGHLRSIMTKHFQNLHEIGERPIAILLASMAAIYQRYGYAIVCNSMQYNIDPRQIRFAFPKKTTGTLLHLSNSDADFNVMAELYRKFSDDKTGYLERVKAEWDFVIMANVPVGGQLIKAVYEENGEPLGYVIYVTHPQKGTPFATVHQLIIRDLVWLNIDAYRAIWEHFSCFDLFATISWGRVPTDDPLQHLLVEPRLLQATMKDCLLGRIVDVDKALTKRSYQEKGELTFEVEDEICTWNQGCWKLEASPDGSHIARTREKPQLVMPVSTLAKLVFGQISATEAARMGRLEVNEASALSVWDKVMKTLYAPACADSF